MALPNQPTERSETVLVHETHRPPAPVLRYIDQVVGTPSTGVEFRYSRGVLTSFDVDVVHVAEPNLDLLLGTRGVSPYQRLLSTLALARNLRKHQIALVRTYDGYTAPRPKADRLSERVLDRMTSLYITVDPSVSTPAPDRTTVIPHPHYRDRFVGYPRGEQVQGRMLCITQGYLPASARGLLAVARVTSTPGVTLRLAGRATRTLIRSIRSAVAQHSGIVSARLEHLSDGAQVQEIDGAELVVVPRIESMEDLQDVFLALSLDRPVLAPRTAITARLADEVGPGWLHLSDGPMTAEDVDTAFSVLRASDRSDRPNLEGRDLEATHAAYATAFRAAKRSRKR